MAYLQASEGEPVPHDLIVAMAQAFGFEVPAEDVEPLAGALRDQLASIGRIEQLDLTEIAPVLQFDPRWHD